MEHSRVAPAWFNKELQRLNPDLRMEWGRERLGVERWIILRRIASSLYGKLLAEFEEGGQERFVEQTLTDDNGQPCGTRRYDLCPEWAVAHIVEDKGFDIDDPRGYREPDNRDIQAIYRWLHEFKNVEEQMRAMNEEHERAEAKKKEERVGILAREIVSSRGTWEDPDPFIFDGRKAMPGTEIGAK